MKKSIPHTKNSRSMISAKIAREPNGRRQRSHGPDRGTDEAQAKRAALTGDAKRPIDMTDPIDWLHRGMAKQLTDSQASAAHFWRGRSAAVMMGTGPRLAMLRDPVAPGEDMPERKVRQAKDALEKIDLVLRGCGQRVWRECRAVVLDRQPHHNLADLVTGLAAIAKEYGF